MSDEKPLVESPERRQLVMAPLDLEQIVPEEHPARAVWAYEERLDLSASPPMVSLSLRGRDGDADAALGQAPSWCPGAC